MWPEISAVSFCCCQKKKEKEKRNISTCDSSSCYPTFTPPLAITSSATNLSALLAGMSDKLVTWKLINLIWRNLIYVNNFWSSSLWRKGYEERQREGIEALLLRFSYAGYIR